MASRTQYVELGDGWQSMQTGRYRVWRDLRDLLTMYHPFADSATGDFGMAHRRVVIPDDWPPPYTLSFYCTDDYTADETGPPTGGWSTDSFRQHRYKEALVNGEVVWASDVADADTYGNRELIRVDLTPHVGPGEEFELAIRVLDRVGTDTVLPTDMRRLSGQNPGGPADLEVAPGFSFRNYVYWGDISISAGDGAASVTGPRPREATARAQLGPDVGELPIPYGEALPDVAELELDTPSRLPTGGFPATCGVPLPFGRVRDPGAVTLRCGDGEAVPVQTSALNRWPDGSVRWLLMTFDAKRSARRDAKWRLELTPPAVQPRARATATVEMVGAGARIDTGVMTLSMGHSPGVLIDEVRLPGRELPVAAGVSAYMVARAGDGQEALSATVERMEVVERGPLRVTVEQRGTLAGQSLTVGRFVFRVHAYAGRPYLRAFLRVFNDTGGDLEAEEFGLTIPVSMPEGRAVAWGAGRADRLEATGDVALEQTTAGSYRVLQSGAETVAGERAEGWMSVSDGDISALVAVRRFWQQFPKALRSSHEGLQVALSIPTDSEPCYRPHDGEAKRHEILLGFLPGALRPTEARALAQAFEDPPRLMDKVWFCKSGGFGLAHWRGPDSFPELIALRGAPPAINAPEGIGLRHFGDAPYGNPDAPGPGTWRNNYYDCAQGLLAEYLMSGERGWFDRFNEYCEHLQDVDICHHSARHPEWTGLLHTIAQDHSIWGGPHSAFQRGIGLCMNWRLTGDPDSRDAFIGMAEAISRTRMGEGTTLSRYWAGHVTTLAQAYDETWDERWAQECRWRVEELHTRIIDPRRGVHMDQHGHYNYRGMVPWMNAQVSRALYLYYRLTGDRVAADAIVATAEALIEEGMTPEGRLMSGYSTNPYWFGDHPGYNVLIAPAILYAYELTGTPAFLAVGRALYQRAIEAGRIESPLNCAWNTPTLLYYLNRYDAIEAAPPWERPERALPEAPAPLP